ncbi:MAG: HutD family protein, partial [Burkholderiaceae bacterium]
MRKLTAADYAVMPWKNGGGVTTELAIAPAGASLDDFDWRISSAEVCAAGPFSGFDGIERSLAILDGAGLRLRIDGDTEVVLRPDIAPFAFAGERPVEAEL